MGVTDKQIEVYIEHLYEHPRSEVDLKLAIAMRKLFAVYKTSFELVHAKNHDYRNACYAELVDLIKGKEVT